MSVAADAGRPDLGRDEPLSLHRRVPEVQRLYPKEGEEPLDSQVLLLEEGF